MTDESLLTEIPNALQKVLSANLGSDEQVLVRIKGAFKEALVCTDRRVMIVKSGFMTGQMFGSDVFQVAYGGIASAEVKYRILSGYFEVSTGGMQNLPKSYWSLDKNVRAENAPNCVSLNSRSQAASFRNACSFIMQRIELLRRAPVAPASGTGDVDIASALERLLRLKADGVLDQAEFDAAKRKLLSGS